MSDARETHSGIPVRGRGTLPTFIRHRFFSLSRIVNHSPNKEPKQTREREKEGDEWKNKKEQRVGWEFFSQPLHHAVKNTQRRPPWGCSWRYSKCLEHGSSRASVREDTFIIWAARLTCHGEIMFHHRWRGDGESFIPRSILANSKFHFSLIHPIKVYIYIYIWYFVVVNLIW